MATPPTESEPEEQEEVQMPLKLEAGPRKDQILAIFKVFDTAGDGKIPLASLSKATYSVGPAESHDLLRTMRQMDINKDGFVEANEWEMYFAALVASLSGDEFDMLLMPIERASVDYAAVQQALKFAEASDAPLENSAEAAEEALEMLAEMRSAMTAAQMELVTDLFKAWDFNQDNIIQIEKLQTMGVEVGPRKEAIFADFAMMDTNGDGGVDMDEMLNYFSVLATTTSEAAFEDIVRDMKVVAVDELALGKMLKMAQALQGQEASSSVVEDDDMAPLVELTPDRTLMVDELFMVFSNDRSPIDLATLMSTKIDVGPLKHRPLESMKAMDANGDGKVDIDEMRLYFQVVGSDLSDEAFKCTLDELKDSAHAANALELAVKISGGM